MARSEVTHIGPNSRRGHFCRNIFHHGYFIILINRRLSITDRTGKGICGAGNNICREKTDEWVAMEVIRIPSRRDFKISTPYPPAKRNAAIPKTGLHPAESLNCLDLNG